MRRGGRGEERDTTMHLIKIQVFTHASRVTIFSTFIFKMKALESWSFNFYNQMTQGFPWIWDRIEAYQSPKNRPEGVLRLPVSRSSHANLAVRIDLPEMMLDGQF